jgi:hypothetical protein
LSDRRCCFDAQAPIAYEIKILFATLLTLALFTAGYAQTPDKAKLDLAGKTFYGHTGGGDNYGAWLAYLPEEKLAVAYQGIQSRITRPPTPVGQASWPWKQNACLRASTTSW